MTTAGHYRFRRRMEVSMRNKSISQCTAISKSLHDSSYFAITDKTFIYVDSACANRRLRQTQVVNIIVLRKLDIIYLSKVWVRSWWAQGEYAFNSFSFILEEYIVFSPLEDVLKSSREDGRV